MSHIAPDERKNEHLGPNSNSTPDKPYPVNRPMFQATLKRDMRVASAGPCNPSPTHAMIGGQ